MANHRQRKSGSQNSATSATERIHTRGSTASVHVARRFCELLSVPLTDLLGLVASTDDMQGAFRQIPVAPSSLCYTVIGAWNPEIPAMSFFQLCEVPFGLKGAVLDFNRISAALLAIRRRWLALPALAFYDDLRVAELVGSCPSGSDCLNELFEWLGFRLDPTKHQRHSSSIVFLGTLEASMRDGDPELFGLLPKPGRVEKFLKDVGVLVGKIFCVIGRIGVFTWSFVTSLIHYERKNGANSYG